MKQEKGITLVSLIIYVLVMIIVIGIITTMILKFKENNNAIQKSGEDVLEFNKFNTYFLKEIKKAQNKVERIGDNYILFSSGNSFSLVNNVVRYNDISISKKVQALNFSLDEMDNSIIIVNIKYENFSKNMKYKLEEIF